MEYMFWKFSGAFFNFILDDLKQLLKLNACDGARKRAGTLSPRTKILHLNARLYCHSPHQLGNSFHFKN